MADPITAAAIETDPRYVIEGPDGIFDCYDITYTPEHFQRFRVGRNCFRCWEGQEIAYFLATTAQSERTPERHLPGCEYEGRGIRERQQRDISREFDGVKWIGPRLALEEAIAEDDEKRAKYRRDTGRKAGAWVPPWVRL